MSFQAYLDTIEEDRPPANSSSWREGGCDDPATKAEVILDWLKADYGLGRATRP